ncbi:MAG: DUF3276 family protein [Treponema sp.]|jgi:hypothetical protein|nr:DUF3276 family protein [Treponema sp.]
MGLRGEIFSTRVQLQNRTYFFNVKENRLGDIYLNIVESKNKDEGGFERQSVVLFADDLTQFLGGFEEALKVMDKADREKKRVARGAVYSAVRGNSRGDARSDNYSGGGNYGGDVGASFPKKRLVVRKFKGEEKKSGAPWDDGKTGSFDRTKGGAKKKVKAVKKR